MKTLTPLLLLSIALLALSASAFQQGPLPRPSSRLAPRSVVPTAQSPLFGSELSAQFASNSDESTTSSTSATATASFLRTVRNRLRTATGFSFTVFRATLRGITGISLTTLYAGTLAVTGLWIRKAMSTVLGLFPSGFRYFLQPFLVLYYTPLILLRSAASPTTRKRAVKKHETVVEAYKEAVTLAEETEKSGYWPVVVSDDGYFELAKPPSVGESGGAAKMAEAVAEAVQHAMEINSDEDKK